MVSKSGCMGWFQKRTNLEKTLLSVSSLLLLTLLLMIIFGVAYHGKKSDKVTEEEHACWTQECIEAAGKIISTMNSKANPCSNFYEFSCGKYDQKAEEVSSVSKRTRDSLYFSLKNVMESPETMDIQAFEEARKFYKTCVKFGTFRQDVKETRESFLSLMSELGIGIWPLIDPLYDVESFSLEHTLASLILLDVPVVFRMDVVPDEFLKGSYLVKISPGGPHESGRNPNDIRDDVRLRSRVLTSLLLLGASAANTDVNDILSVDSAFAAIEQDEDTICDKNVLAPQEVLSELNRLIPEINWAIILPGIRNATGLMRSFAVELFCKQKIRDYVVHLNDLSIRSETNYLGWRFFSEFVEDVIPTFERSQFENDEVTPRWRVCLELLEKYSSPVLAEALTKKTVSKEMQNEVEKISKAVLSTTERLVTQASWLSDSQKFGILEKVARIKMIYPFPMEAAKRISRVRMPEVHVSNFTAVTIRLQRQWVIQKFRKLFKIVRISNVTEPWSFLVSPTKDTMPSDYTIAIYFDKIQVPYFNSHGSDWMNFGGYGTFVAREISKALLGFMTGSTDGDVINLWNLWSDYKNSTLCMRSYPLFLNRNLERPMDKNMIHADFLEHSAIEIAYEAARSAASSSTSLPGLELSTEEMFFLAYAQTLCDGRATYEATENIPLKERFNSAVAHVKAFRDVFGCTGSSPYCEIWT